MCNYGKFIGINIFYNTLTKLPIYLEIYDLNIKQYFDFSVMIIKIGTFLCQTMMKNHYVYHTIFKQPKSVNTQIITSSKNWLTK